MSASAPAAEGEGTPTQPASEKEPEMPGPREESEEEEDEDDEEEEEEEKEKSLIVEGKREKKKVERLTMQVSSLQREPFTIAQGKGQKLCEIERIHFFLSKKKTDELRNLHKLLYNRPGTVRPFYTLNLLVYYFTMESISVNVSDPLVQFPHFMTEQTEVYTY
ncbi:DEK proto-oncogene [Homo sapiens]|uniref:DEK proto-oncogene n=1 Tax=Homo sapiens TaxID=9606 RepID=D6R9L5_HUMAN|nr:DEK proto-oncogene [Homo sapiens]KAI4016956.1 DEK proto-oncogene [Homo sapiens]